MSRILGGIFGTKVTTVPTPHAIPRADESGKLDSGWITAVPGGGSGSGLSATYSCPVTVQVRDAVFVSGSDTVDRASNTGLATTPTIGFVQDKPTTTTCVVQTTDELSGFSGLTPGPQWLGVDGGIVAAPPEDAGLVVQPVGTARSATVLHVDPEPTFLL